MMDAARQAEDLAMKEERIKVLLCVPKAAYVGSSNYSKDLKVETWP